MTWHKLGRVFCPSGETAWMHSHAAVPVAEAVKDDIYRIYFSSRDASNRSFTGHVVIDLNEPDRILDISRQPVLVPGALGEFDDSGAMASWLVQHGDERWLYYIGWNLGVSVPFRNSIGLAVSKAGGPFVRRFDGPIVDRSMTEPHFCASCCVLPGEGGDIWRMWYLSCTGWMLRQGKPEHKYHIKYAESDDGVHWRRDGSVAIDFLDDKEYAISRPSVVRDDDGWKMWFSSRGDSYRIAYAESEDGRHWRRQPSAGIDVSPDGWDSEMIEYPFVFDHQGRRYMLYNGNGYGKTGFGLAIKT
jgi:hypothetical protein